jgi:hypothetical protein
LLVGPGLLQFIAQQSRAAATCGELSCSKAFLQQSIMPDSPPLDGMGTPANTLPPSNRTKTKDAIRFVIVLKGLCEGMEKRVKQIDGSTEGFTLRVRRFIESRFDCLK